MEWFSIILILFGLSLFEIITSVDNSIINAEVLSTMSKRARRWFLIWGIIIAVFVVRGILPFILLWASNPSLGLADVWRGTLSSDPAFFESVENFAPILLVGGGTFLVFLFFHWIFLEPKYFGIIGEEYIQKKGVWFYAVVSILLAIIVWFSLKIDPLIAFAAVIGSTAFFITHGFKENAKQMERKMLGKETRMTDVSKIFYLEVIDSTFSIDGVIGAFAFTFFIPLILIGNGIGAIVVRQLTIKNIENIKKYKYIKNGAMYSIFVLGAIMLIDGFGFHIPIWIAPAATFVIIGFFFYRSVK